MVAKETNSREQQMNKVRHYLENLDALNLAGWDRMHPRVLKKLAEVILEPLATLFEN